MRCTSSVAWNMMTVTFTMYAFKMLMAVTKNLTRSQNWLIFWPVVMSLLLTLSCFDAIAAECCTLSNFTGSLVEVWPFRISVLW